MEERNIIGFLPCFPILDFFGDNFRPRFDKAEYALFIDTVKLNKEEDMHYIFDIFKVVHLMLS